MCPPNHFEVAYVINPWMEGNISRGSNNIATRQWEALAQLIGQVAAVERMTPEAGVPDMVFTANAGLILGDKCVLSRFRHPERQAEEPHFGAWFRENGFDVLELPQDMVFEGAGDALLDRGQPLLWLGHGHRSTLECVPLLKEFLDIEIEPLRLVDERFYHLDTCLCPLEGGYLMYYPTAFDAESQARIMARVPAERRIAVGPADAHHFACNAVNSAGMVFMNRASKGLVRELQSRGFRVKQTPLTEFMKAGGSAKCLTLKLTEDKQSPDTGNMDSRSVA